MLADGQLEVAGLLVSELVSNAVRHGRGRVKLDADLNEERLLVKVTDEGSGFEHEIRQQDFQIVQGCFGA